MLLKIKLQYLKDNFQSVSAHSREFVCVSCKTSQNVNISQMLTWNKTTAMMDAKWPKLYASFFLISLDETTLQL